MPSSEDQNSLAAYVAGRLEAASEELVDQWLDVLQGRLGVRPSRLLPTEDLRDHIPEVIRRVAEALATPMEPVDPNVAERLQNVALLRREQGYDIEELLVEFRELQDILTARFRQLVDEYPGDPSPADVADVATRLHKAQAALVLVTVSTYRREEARLKRELGERISEYARAITHQLKNPLSAASTSAEMLQEADLADPQVERFTGLVVKSLDRMESLIEDIRTLVIEEGTSDGRRVSLQEAVESVFEEVRDRASEKGVALEVDGELPDARVDAGQVEIALINLVANAVKYCDEEKEDRWVRVGAERVEAEGMHGDRWCIRVADNGLGIPEEFRDRVFQRHFRAHPDVAEGTGLGLSLTHHLVTRRGGSIEFESSEGRGTTFRVTVPARQEGRGE